MVFSRTGRGWVRWGRTALLALLVAGLGGCGLADYEARMRENQARAKRFDEENKLLGQTPLVVPTREVKKGKTKKQVALANAFVRVPAGINTTANKDRRNGLLYVYAGGKQSVPFTQVEVAYGTGQKHFAREVLSCFANLSGKTRKRQVRSATGEGTITYRTTEFDDGQSACSINIFTGKKKALAVVFWLQKDKLKIGQRAIEMCLEWSGVGSQADKLRAAFLVRSPLLGKRPPGAPPR
jgi:hypothetical protein